MGDAVEGSGGLGLQVAIDRRVVVFGRGRVLPDPNQPHPPTMGGRTRQRSPSAAGVSRMAVLEEGAGEGGDVAAGGSGGGNGSGFPAAKLLEKWSVNQRRKNA